jgi:hypothetical protein
MPASPLIQLVSTGQMDEYFTNNPQMSYFKYAYKRHTKFAMDSLKISFEGTEPCLKPSTNDMYRLKIPRHGDMFADANLVFTLPEIFSSDTHRFRWIENAAVLFIKKAEIFIGGYGRAIDTLYGEWMLVWNELTLDLTKKAAYANLVGNVVELTNPRLTQKTISYINNKAVYTYYPKKIINSIVPSINKRIVSVPLSFYFTRNVALAIPLCALQINEVIINIETESSESLYQLYDFGLNQYVSSSFYNRKYNTNLSLKDFVRSSTDDININCYMECKYLYLDNYERTIIALNKRNNEFLVETIYKKTTEVVDSSITIDLDLNAPVKEIIWTIKKRNYSDTNKLTDYTNNGQVIMKTAKILWNRSNERVEEKEAFYYNKIIPYQHHTNIPSPGIYCYTFALKPESISPSGYFLPSGKFSINTGVYVTLENTDVIDYEITFYAITYNILHIIGGQAGLKFS